MPSNLDSDVFASITAASKNASVLDAGITELRDAVAVRNWAAIEPIRDKLIAAIDGYVDNYVAAARRVEFEGLGGIGTRKR